MVLEVKEWFVNKNGLNGFIVEGIMAITEKAVKVCMTKYYGNKPVVQKYWCPKSCLELVDSEIINPAYQVEASTIDEAIEKLYITDDSGLKFIASMYC